MQNQVDHDFPIKTEKVPIKNKPWFNYRLRQLSENKKKIFKTEGRSDRYKAAVKEFKAARVKQVNKYVETSIDKVTNPEAPNIHTSGPSKEILYDSVPQGSPECPRVKIYLIKTDVCLGLSTLTSGHSRTL